MILLYLRLWKNKIFELPGLFGRSRTINGVKEFQLLKEHLHGTAKLCIRFCVRIGARRWGFFIGILHDAGKASLPFQHQRLCVDPSDVRSQEPTDHATWGARYLYNKFKQKGQKEVGRVLAFIGCGHHSGLTNSLAGQTENFERSTLEWRLTQENIPAIPDFALKEYEKIPYKKLKLPRNSFKRFVFIKLLFSSLIDADRLDSEKYNDESRHELRTYESIKVLYKRMKKHLKNLAHKENQTAVDKIRTAIQKRCYEMAKFAKGFFTLTVPTGGGKTFGSAIFALRHAVKHRLDRVIILSSYITIIDQNVDALQSILGTNNVLEHHCRFEWDKKKNGHYVYIHEDLDKHFLAAENWESPVIMATNVNFFESFYDFHASRCRKLHNITNSVIVFDEAHLLPPRYMKACIAILKELVKSYNCTILFSTATQPGLLKKNKLLWAIDKSKEIIKDPASLYKQLERVRYEYRPKIKRDNQLVHLIRSFPSVMCIVNTRRHALILYDDLRGLRNNTNTYHLSTLMCSVHRRIILDKIKNDLALKRPCRVISTQLVECGVCLDFPVVIRNRTGISSIIQSAGRCNREGLLLDKGLLIITNVDGSGHDLHDNFVEEATNIARRYMERGYNLLDPDAAQNAFVELYQNFDNALDKKEILSLIEEQGIDIPFYEISRRFKIIEAGQESVIIPYDEKARQLIEQLRILAADGVPSSWYIHTVRALQPYTVQVYPNDLEKIQYAIDESVEPYRILIDGTLYDGPNDATNSPGTGIKIWTLGELNKYRTSTKRRSS